jgi:hypothetical protein
MVVEYTPPRPLDTPTHLDVDGLVVEYTPPKPLDTPTHLDVDGLVVEYTPPRPLDTPTHLDVDGLVETVHLVEKLHEDALNLAVCAGLSVETGRGDGVDLMGDRRRIVPS